MHPSDFHLDHRLSDWLGYCLEVRCSCSPGITIMPVPLLTIRHGDCLFGDVLARLQCSACKGQPSPVYLVAGQNRTSQHGPLPCCALELVLAP